MTTILNYVLKSMLLFTSWVAIYLLHIIVIPSFHLFLLYILLNTLELDMLHQFSFQENANDSIHQDSPKDSENLHCNTPTNERTQNYELLIVKHTKLYNSRLLLRCTTKLRPVSARSSWICSMPPVDTGLFGSPRPRQAQRSFPAVVSASSWSSPSSWKPLNI